MEKLSKVHKEHIALYGDGNEQRLTGHHETSSIDQFSFKQRSRGCSIRIPVYTANKGFGYFEDRRPASNIDAYLVTAALVDTCILGTKHIHELIRAL